MTLLSFLASAMLIMFLFSVYKHDDKGFKFFGLGLLVILALCIVASVLPYLLSGTPLPD